MLTIVGGGIRCGKKNGRSEEETKFSCGFVRLDGMGERVWEMSIRFGRKKWSNKAVVRVDFEVQDLVPKAKKLNTSLDSHFNDANRCAFEAGFKQT
ncbi:hypothetical protein KFK09_002433 [Dendrobium nobile]|uniref:Uncharacterized protein n=1 Tax=Dendrobium nobile TaxID=94219 RepID=A0A8T3C1D5_DENNO|nr:hypothetical protein KFK09_002433 [Dendrobium nobile]